MTAAVSVAPTSDRLPRLVFLLPLSLASPLGCFSFCLAFPILIVSTFGYFPSHLIFLPLLCLLSWLFFGGCIPSSYFSPLAVVFLLLFLHIGCFTLLVTFPLWLHPHLGCIPSWLHPSWLHPSWLHPIFVATCIPLSCIPILVASPSWLHPLLVASPLGCIPSWLHPLLVASPLGCNLHSS